jgi:hypothetical protein
VPLSIKSVFGIFLPGLKSGFLACFFTFFHFHSHRYAHEKTRKTDKKPIFSSAGKKSRTRSKTKIGISPIRRLPLTA